MSGLYTYNEVFTNGFDFNLVNIVSLLSILFGVFIITTKNPVLSILYLIGLFLSIAIYLMSLGLNFIGLSYLLVYVGAVSILFLFILMLINVRVSELVTDNSNSLFLAMIITILFSVALSELLPSNFKFIMDDNISKLNESSYEDSSSINIDYNFIDLLKSIVTNINNIVFVSSKSWDSVLIQTSHITGIGNVIYTVYPIWLIITSMILLLAMVGSIIITIRRGKEFNIVSVEDLYNENGDGQKKI